MLEHVNDGITLLFIIELSLRCCAAPSRKRFFCEFWIDIIACLPLFRDFLFAGALCLLRTLGLVTRVRQRLPVCGAALSST